MTNAQQPREPDPADLVRALEQALQFLRPDDGVGDEILPELKRYGERAYALWSRWLGDEGPARALWDAAQPGKDGVGLIFTMAMERGWDTRSLDARTRALVAGAAEEPLGMLPPQYSEERLAAEFTKRFGQDWRHVAEWAKWYGWNGTRWTADNTLKAFDLARTVAREAAGSVYADEGLREGERRRAATLIASARTVAAIERLARADRAHALSSGDWDRDPWLLNTAGGVVELRTGKLAVHDRQQYMTKAAGASPGGACAAWLAFLGRVTGGDRELEAFLQRFVGYCLTGSTREHALLFLYGLGGNGKTTFLSTIQAALGDYATTAPMETFVETHSERHPTDLAMLRGARLVVAQEVEDGQRWAVSRIKQLTGGDTIRARFMRQDYFEYTPQFKLILAGNHKPAFRQVDEAIRRRFYLVPFTHTIPAHERDPHLPEKLRDELPGVLAWALAGCKQWQTSGLRPPESVRAATQAYLEDEDIMRTWLTEACELEPKAFAPIAELHSSYQTWAEKAGERFVGMKRFGQALEDQGFKRDRTRTARGFWGLRLRGEQRRLVA